MKRSRAWFERRMRELAAIVRRLPVSRQRAFDRHVDEAVEAEAAETRDGAAGQVVQFPRAPASRKAET
jgi:hypothetical protein